MIQDNKAEASINVFPDLASQFTHQYIHNIISVTQVIPTQFGKYYTKMSLPGDELYSGHSGGQQPQQGCAGVGWVQLGAKAEPGIQVKKGEIVRALCQGWTRPSFPSREEGPASGSLGLRAGLRISLPLPLSLLATSG